MRSFFQASVFFCGATLVAATASAEEVALPEPPAVDAATQSTTTTVTTTTTAKAAPQQPAAPAVPAPPAQPIQPAAPALPLPPVAGTQGPVYYNGPVWVVPAPVTGQPVPQYPQMAPPLPPPPAVYAPPPPPVYQRTASCCGRASSLYMARAARGPMFGLGLRFTALGVSQKVWDQDVNMLGGGLMLRFRTQGHFGIETAFDVAQASIDSGAGSTFQRTAYPVTVAAMLYLFRNRPDNHFNIYGVAGFGLMANGFSLKTSFDGRPREVNQQFLEFLGQAGGGVELRFNRLALTADIRAIGLARDDNGPAGSYYQNVEGGPVPSTSAGYKFHAGALLWF